MNTTLTLERAEMMVRFAEMQNVFWADWHHFTDVEYDALAYLVENSGKIVLPNVKSLTVEKTNLLRDYKGYLEIGCAIK